MKLLAIYLVLILITIGTLKLSLTYFLQTWQYNIDYNICTICEKGK